jgi:hypothetical protein
VGCVLVLGEAVLNCIWLFSEDGVEAMGLEMLPRTPSRFLMCVAG